MITYIVPIQLFFQMGLLQMTLLPLSSTIFMEDKPKKKKLQMKGTEWDSKGEEHDQNDRGVRFYQMGLLIRSKKWRKKKEKKLY